MKKLHYLFFILCGITHLISFSSCGDDEAPPPIDLESISKVYKGDELRIFLNGEEYSSPGEEVGLALASLFPDHAKDGDVSSGQKMLLKLLPLWPNVRVYPILDDFETILMEVEAISSSDEVHLKGHYTDAPQYTLGMEGYYRDNVLTLNLTYTTDISGVTGSTFIFDFSKESIDLLQLHPIIKFVEYDGQQIPVEEFVRDAMTPVLEVIGKQLGGPLQIAFFPDGSTKVGIKAQGKDTFTPMIGKHGYRFHLANWGYLFADTQGAVWMDKTVEDRELIDISPLYAWYARDKHFISVFYGCNRDSDLLFTIEAPAMCQFRNFLSPWLDVFGNGRVMSKEETEKCRMVLNMIYDKQIELICLRGTKQPFSL